MKLKFVSGLIQIASLWCIKVLKGSKITFLSRFNRYFRFYLNFDLLLKIEATYSIAQIIKSGCNLIARKRLASTKIL